MLLRVCLQLLCMLITCLIVRCELLSTFSFAKPFNTIPGEVRHVNDKWAQGGDAVVQQYFVRLTPDRQHKKGFIWNSNHLKTDEFSIIFNFRISGQGENLFGDGIALWITQHGTHVPGNNHGFTDKYLGITIFVYKL